MSTRRYSTRSSPLTVWLPILHPARDERFNNHPLHVAVHPTQQDLSSSLKQVSSEEPEFPPTESPMSSPQSESVTKSPEVLPESGSNSALSPSVEAEATPSPEVNQRRVSAASSSRSAGGEREKRKRSRVTPDQLVHLERFFSMDRSPTAARRREISELLGMQERQTQIWFQNRWATLPSLKSITSLMQWPLWHTGAQRQNCST